MVMMNNGVTVMKKTTKRKSTPTRPGKSPSSAQMSAPAPTRPPAFLTIDEVAAVLRCSVRSVYRLVDTGRILPPTRFGGLLRWNAAAFDAWIAEGAPPPYRPSRSRR